MQREIKFRALVESSISDETHIIVPKLIIGFSNIDGSIDKIYGDDGYKYTSDVYNIRLMQYTGLKDKNGVEIYEGDIILTADDIRKQAIGNWKPKMRIVEWTDNKEYKTGFNLGKAQDGECEVIGNIYENRELLENKS